MLKLKMQFLIDFRKTFSGFSCWNVLELNPAFLGGLTMPERGTLRTKTAEEEEAEEKCEGTERNYCRMRTRARTFKGGAVHFCEWDSV